MILSCQNIEKAFLEKQVLKNIMEDSLPRTCIVTTHRPTALKLCKKVYALQDTRCRQLLPEEIQDDLINAVVACHNGVYRMIPDAPEVVETSSYLSIVRTSEGLVEIQILVRSSSETMKMALASDLVSTFALAGA